MDIGQEVTSEVYVVGDHVDSDVIIPAQYLGSMEPEDLGPHALENLLGQAVPFRRDGKYQILVAGVNFACGSSREHAIIALQGAGIKAIVCKSMARIPYRTCINLAVIPVQIADLPPVETGEIATVRLAREPEFIYRGHTYIGKPLDGPALEIIQAGGLVEHIRKRFSS